MSRNMIRFGYAIPVMFLVTILGCGLFRDSYNHLTNLVSELGYLGSPTQYWFTIGLLICSFLSFWFVMALVSECKRQKLSVLPVVILFSFTFSIAGAGIFPMPTWWHGILGMPSFLLLFSPVLAYILWRNNEHIPYLKQWVVVVMIFFLLGFLVFAPEILPGFQGMKQRFFHLGWMIWFVYLSWAFGTFQKGDYSTQ